MKTIKEWLETLEEPYRSQAIKNTEESLLPIERESLDDAIIKAFTWSDTEEGFNHWNALYNSVQ